MSPLEKVKIIKKLYDKNPMDEKLGVRYRKNLWEPMEIEELKKDFPWLPRFYLDFIKEFDSAGLGWFTFYGSRKSKIISVHDEVEYWKDHSKGRYFPFGKDSSGSIFNFNKKGEIILFDIEDYNWEKPIYIDSTIESFINDCLLGKRYSEFSFTQDNPFYDFLKSQGWA
jgi:hypothetical protein